MTSINTAAYYQLSGNASNSSSASSSTTSPTDMLLQALNSATSDTSSNNNSSYSLNLSPQAQQYMNSSSPSSATSSNFVLSPQQEQAITKILDKYKNAPQTQATFDQIQNDLNTAGLGASQLSLQDQATNFSPTALFIDDLSGNTSGAAAITSPDETTKSSNYMQQIISQWQTIAATNTNSTSTNSTKTA